MKKRRSLDMIAFDGMVGQRLRILRKAHGKTQKAIAERLDLDRTSLSFFENGTHAISLYYVTILADYYGVHLDLLVGDGADFEAYVTDFVRKNPSTAPAISI